jgi:hypothetical protein
MRPWDLRLAVSPYTAPTAPVRRLRHAPAAAFASYDVQAPAPAAFKGEGSKRFDCFLVPVVELATSSSLVLPHRVAPEQGRASPRPALATAAGRARAAVEPSRPSLPSGPPPPSAPIASPATRGPRGAAGCRTRGAAAAGLWPARRRCPSPTSQARDPPQIGP